MNERDRDRFYEELEALDWERIEHDKAQSAERYMGRISSFQRQDNERYRLRLQTKMFSHDNIRKPSV